MVSFFFSCSPARRIPDDRYLLKKNKLEINSKDIPPETLTGYIQQKPNKKVLGLRFHLWLYNMANPAKQGWPHGWLRRIGEEPVVYDCCNSGHGLWFDKGELMSILKRGSASGVETPWIQWLRQIFPDADAPPPCEAS